MPQDGTTLESLGSFGLPSIRRRKVSKYVWNNAKAVLVSSLEINASGLRLSWTLWNHLVLSIHTAASDNITLKRRAPYDPGCLQMGRPHARSVFGGRLEQILFFQSWDAKYP